VWDLFACYLGSILAVFRLCWDYTCSLNLSNNWLRIKRHISNFKFWMSMNRIVTKVFFMAVNAVISRINISGRLMKLLLRIHHVLVFIHDLANWSRWFWVAHILQLFDVIYLVRWQKVVLIIRYQIWLWAQLISLVYTAIIEMLSWNLRIFTMSRSFSTKIVLWSICYISPWTCIICWSHSSRASKALILVLILLSTDFRYVRSLNMPSTVSFSTFENGV
jgi:hypothetical protein